jgi:hypothetical protein
MTKRTQLSPFISVKALKRISFQPCFGPRLVCPTPADLRWGGRRLVGFTAATPLMDGIWVQ